MPGKRVSRRIRFLKALKSPSGPKQIDYFDESPTTAGNYSVIPRTWTAFWGKVSPQLRQ
jgi:hypothetical protein